MLWLGAATKGRIAARGGAGLSHPQPAMAGVATLAARPAASARATLDEEYMMRSPSGGARPPRSNACSTACSGGLERVESRRARVADVASAPQMGRR